MFNGRQIMDAPGVSIYVMDDNGFGTPIAMVNGYRCSLTTALVAFERIASANPEHVWKPKS